MASEKYFRYPTDWKLTQESLKEIMSYCPESGEFKWVRPTTGRCKVGDLVGSNHTRGYKETSLKGNRVLLHRLAYLYMEGVYPTDVIDHEDGNKQNNKWDNLRDVTQHTNTLNQKMRDCNTSGTTGVTWDKSKDKWVAQIGFKGVNKHLGRFTNIDDAIKARKLGERELGFHENHGRVD